MPPPDLSRYKLSDEDSARIFHQEILPAEFPDSSTAPPPPTDGNASSTHGEAPLAILAVGQTGAGKTRLAPVLLSALRAQSGPFAHFIADTYKTYHPAYDSLAQSSPQLASPATGPDARRWLHMASEAAIARRLNVLLESACRHPDDFTQLAALFRAASYRVDVVVLAVPAALSRLGILTRFHQRLPEAGSGNLPPRLTPLKVHDDSYDGLLHAAAFLDESGAADRVFVVRRGNLVAHKEEKGPDGGMVMRGVAAAVERERMRPLTEEERQRATDDLEKLAAYPEATESAQKIKLLLDPLIQKDDTQPETFPELTPLELE